MTARRGLSLATVLGIGLLTALASGDLHRTRYLLEVEPFRGPFLQGTLAAAEHVSTGVADTTDGRTDFTVRPVLAALHLTLPFCSRDQTVSLVLRSYTRVYTLVDVYLAGDRRQTLPVKPMKWDLHRASFATEAKCGPGLDVRLAMRQKPEVRGRDVERPEMLVDYLEVEAKAGLTLAWRDRLLMAAIPLAAFVFSRLIGLSPRIGALLAASSALLGLVFLRLDPVPVLLAVPRVMPLGFATGLVAWRLALRGTEGATARALAILVFASALLHGAWVFLPGHLPPDIYIHQQRTLDLARVPLTYDGLLTYGSHFPTPSQDRGEATEALGSGVRIPYSPLPYLGYFALHLLGLDLAWAMTATNAAVVSLLGLAMFGVARLAWGTWAGWLAALLYWMDLSVWHHLGRSHAPAVVGGVLVLAAMLFLVRATAAGDTPGGLGPAAAVVALALLGYSASIPLFGLFAGLWALFLLFDNRSLGAPVRQRLALALGLGGVIAGGLFYFHYLPGMLGGVRGMSAGADPFPGRTFFIFHNESRQALRVWGAGFWIPLAAGLLAAPFALRRVSARVRPLLVSWWGAWAAFMLLKELPAFSKLLRWAKEDQFLSPLLCLMIAGAVGPLRPAWLRWLLTLLALGAGLGLHARDYSFHANTLGL